MANGCHRRIVDIYAEQATRKGFKVLFGGEGAAAEEVVGIEQVIEDMHILENFMLASKNSRLYGGAVLLLYIDDGRSADQPVDKSKIYQVEGMEVLDRWQIAPVINEDNLTTMPRQLTIKSSLAISLTSHS
jgi:hypothetical protein